MTTSEIIALILIGGFMLYAYGAIGMPIIEFSGRESEWNNKQGALINILLMLTWPITYGLGIACLVFVLVIMACVTPFYGIFKLFKVWGNLPDTNHEY